MDTTTESAVTRIDPPDKLTQLQTRVLSINEDMPTDDVLAISEAIDSAYERIKELRAMRDEAMITYLIEHGPIESGEMLYCASKDKTVKCRDNGAAFLAVADAAGGDVETIAGVLASGAFKHGACRTLLGDTWDEHFETIERDKIKFSKISTRFLKKGKA
jgi:hypothetical protein